MGGVGYPAAQLAHQPLCRAPGRTGALPHRVIVIEDWAEVPISES